MFSQVIPERVEHVGQLPQKVEMLNFIWIFNFQFQLDFQFSISIGFSIFNFKVEMFYDPTGKEAHIQPIGEEYGVVVYNHDLKADSNFFTRSILEENFMKKKKTDRGPIPKDIQEDSLIFESRFESGNLAKATRITDNYYELRLRPDLFTSRHCQWFYFRVQNMRADVEYRFSFVNFLKPDSQYCVGMKPVLYSEKEVALTGVRKILKEILS